MSTTASSHGDVPCPDPSVHSRLSRDTDLQNNASKAALLAAEHKRASSAQSQDSKIDPLGPDGRLSSGAAATSLKYANAQDLPSFPSVGIETTQSGNKAAHLASANYKSPAYPTVETSSSSASKAATLAANKGGHLDLWQYKPDAESNTAAHLAMGKNLGPQLDYGYTDDGRKKALLAATLSTRRKDTAPPPVEEPPVYPDSGNASYNALNAAAVAHRPSTRQSGYTPMADKSLEASRIYHQKSATGSMYGSTPPVNDEEELHQAGLRAAAVAAAKNLYEIEKPAMERIAAGDRSAAKAYNQHYAPTPGEDRTRMEAMNYVKVQEAAQKLAAERLAKLDPDGARAYREHYGVGETPKAQPSTRGSRRGRVTKSPADDADFSSDDEAQAARIRGQTGRLNQQVASIDEQKRTQDRKDLMAAAQRSVQARMSTMDEQVFNQTGKMSPAMQKDWEEKARAKAEADSQQRMVTHGKVHIGGGKYMDQSEVDAIAAARMQPTLDQITQTADLQRARDAEMRLNQERAKEEARAEKQRQADMKSNAKMLDVREKARIQAEKDVEKQRRKEVQEADKAEAQRRKNELDAERAEQKNAEASRAAEEKNRKAAERAEAKETKEQEKAEALRLKEAQTEADKAQAEERKADADADKARAAEAEAAEREADADKRIADTEARRESDEVSPGRGVTSTESTEAPVSPTAAEATTTTTTDPQRRESKLRGFFSKMRGSRQSGSKAPAIEGDASAIADAEKYKSGTGAGEESAELSSRAKGKQRAEHDAESTVSSLEADDDAARGRESTVSDDVFSEARDTVEEPPARISSSPARGGSKFQEDL